MNLGKLGLWMTCLFMLWAGWIVFDMSRPADRIRGVASGALASVGMSNLPVLVEFYADWCGPCRVVGPVVESLAEDLKGRAMVLRVNVDSEMAAARDHGVRSIPTFIAFRNGRETAREVGAIPRERMLRLLGL
jgi:thioredoxin 1